MVRGRTVLTWSRANTPVRVVVVVALVLAASGLAAPALTQAGPQTSWAAPTTLSRSDTPAIGAEIVIDPAGTTTVAWGAWYLDDGGEPGEPRGLVVRRKVAGADWGVEQVLDERAVEDPDDMVVDSAGAVTIGYGQREEGLPTRRRSAKPYALTSDAYGTWGAPVLLNPEGTLRDDTMRLAIAPDGGTTAVWITNLPGKVHVVTSAHRPSGGTWQPAIYLTGPDTSPAGVLEVSAGGGGHVTVVWANPVAGPRLTRVRARTLHDGVWSPTTTLSPVVHRTAQDVALSAGGKGTAMAAWLDLNRDRPRTLGVVAYTLRRPDGSWTPPQAIPGSRGHLTSIRLARSGDRVLAVWGTGENSDPVVSQPFAAARRHGDWGPPASLSRPDEKGGTVDVAGDGSGRFRVARVYKRGGRFPNLYHVQTRHRSLSGVWSDPVRLTSRRVAVSGGTRIAIDSLGDAAVVWPRLGAGSCCSIAHSERVAR
jgi:hypothetical protein